MPAITHTRAAGTLIDGTAKGDGTNLILKACGWRWSRSLGTWYIPQSRDRTAKRHVINRTAGQLKAAGHPATITIDDTARPTSDVEADKIARQEARVEALTSKAARRSAEEEAAWARQRRDMERLPYGGEPIKVGHHSEGRHRAAIARADRSMRAASNSYAATKEAEARAEAATHTTGARYNPVTVYNRIEKLAADRRRIQRLISGNTRTLFISNGVRHTESTPPATAERAERLHRTLAEVEDQINYWTGIRTQQIAQGLAGDYGPKTVAVGDQVLFRSSWYEVRRVNQKSVTVPSIVGGSWTDTIPYREISGHRGRPESA